MKRTVEENVGGVDGEAVPEPKASLDAIADPAPLTIAQLAILERVKSPVAMGGIDSVDDCLLALWLLSLPVREAGRLTGEKSVAELRDEAVGWADETGLDGAAYHAALTRLLRSCAAFWRMLPRPEAKDAKKNGTETAGSPSSRSGRAAPTGGRPNTSSRRPRRSGSR